MPSPLNEALIGIRRRAERSDPALLVETFVDVGTLFSQLSTTDNQIIYGRRGTGKTHAFTYLAETRRKAGDITIYVDMRTIGSTGGLYSDRDLPVAERGTRLLIDTLAAFVDGVTAWLISEPSPLPTDEAFSRASTALDAVAAAVTEVKVVGEVETEHRIAKSASSEKQAGLEARVSLTPDVSPSVSQRNASSESDERRLTQRGPVRHRVHFGELARALRGLASALSGRRMWLLLDEWAEVPRELQPLLADMLRRALFPIREITVKIGTIEHHTELKIQTEDGYIGIDYGTDAGADLNLDDFMVFGSDETRATEFFRTLFFKHVRAVMAVEGRQDDYPATEREMTRQGFTQSKAFDELVRAAEGVPRDAIYIAANAAAKANDDPIAIPDIRTAAHSWYERDKEAAVRASPDAYALLLWIVETAIGSRHVRGFLLRQDIGPGDAVLIDKLYDARVLHLVRRGYSARDIPGVRFNVYVLDYGCYVDLMNTQREPTGFLDEADRGIEVPPDDLRGIRHAVLDLDTYHSRAVPRRDAQV